MDDGKVTVRARDAPLHAVIEKLAKRGGLQVSTHDRLDERVTVELRSLTLTAALQELLRGRSFILIGAPQATDTRQDGKRTLWILAKGLNGSGANVSTSSSDDSRESALREEPRSLDELSAALMERDSNARLDAISELGDRLHDEQATVMLARALTDRDADVRKAAVSALENVGTGRSLQTLAIALRDHDVSVRATAVDAVGEIGGDAARRLLESALADESAVVREAATERLVQTPSSRKEGGR